MIRLMIAVSLLLATAAAQAQERPRTILVLDGSGSMWGQIDGVNKIVIARDVISTILDDFPPDQELGLTVYGHRRKGDCTDIETVIQPGLDTAEAIVSAVNTINPRGSTPLSAAVMAAAEALKFTEEKATVILVSDGIETCDVDPCAVGKQLESLGVDFTAHVIGFDVENDPAARAQLQCLAEETGGTYRAASTASQLIEALSVVSEPDLPTVKQVTLTATIGIGGPRIQSDLSWTVATKAGAPVIVDARGPALTVELPLGDYTASVVRPEDSASAIFDFSVTNDPDQPQPQFVLALPDLEVPVDMVFQAIEGPDGPQITTGLTWTILDAAGVPVLNLNTEAAPTVAMLPGGYTVQVRREADGAEASATFTVAQQGEVVTVVLPEIVRAVAVSLLAREGGPSGPAIPDGINWTITDANGAVLLQTAEPRPTLELMPGAYVVRVTRAEDGAETDVGFAVEGFPETVTVPLPRLERPQEVTFLSRSGGVNIGTGVVWQVMDAAGTTVLQDSADATPTVQLMPGAYSATVVRAEDGAMAGVDFTVSDTAQTVILTLPDLAPAPVRVRIFATDGRHGPRIGDNLIWDLTGPEGEVVGPEQAPSLDLELPKGTYTVEVLRPVDEATAELRFGVGTVDKEVVLELPEYRPAATLSAPDTALVGSLVPVEWTGPDATDDYITVVPPGSDPGRFMTYTYTREGPLLDLRMPSEPGTYEIRYVLNADDKVLATAMIEVMDVTATVTPVDQPVAGSVLTVDWTGPDYKDDYISVTLPGEDKWREYTYTRQGSPLTVQMPSTPGTYDLTYTMQQDDRVLARVTIEVADVGATVSGPETAPAGATIPVDWTGPDDKDDYIAILRRGEDRWQTFTYTRHGSPLNIVLPTEPGEYDIAYVMQKDDRVLARAPITVGGVTATVSAPAEAPAGGSVSVDWTGPDYKDDYIAIIPAEGGRWITYTYTRHGTPLDLGLPPEPGEYAVAYVMQNGDEVLARRPITVTGITATVSGPAQAPAGALVQVDWTGPDYKDDYIAVLPADGGRWLTYTYTREGSPLDLRLPPDPGDYRLAYVMQNGDKVLSEQTITLTGIDATLTPPEATPAGATVPIDWTGPDYKGDFIAVAERGSDKWINYAYTRNGSPAELLLPGDPGEYDLIYVLSQDRKILARAPITVSGIDYSVSAPATAPAGSAVQIDWTGPDYKGDFIAVAREGAPEGKWINYTYTREGTPLALAMPAEPGRYEIRYVLSQGRATRAAAPIEVTAVEATLDGPATAPVGSDIAVVFTGPAYKNDLIAIAAADAADTKWEAYAYARNGSPATVTAPVEPGPYELRYVLSADTRVVLARVPITLTPVSATLEAPATAPAGTILSVDWTGPGYPGDRVEIVRSGETRSLASVRADRGSPGNLDLPEEPGVYELRYVLSQGRTVVTSQPITLE